MPFPHSVGPRSGLSRSRVGRVDFRHVVELWHRSAQPGGLCKRCPPGMRPGTLGELLGAQLGERRPPLERSMTTFDDREKSFERKFALDEELKFRSEQRRNRLLGEWAAAKLGITGTAVADYVKALRKA